MTDTQDPDARIAEQSADYVFNHYAEVRPRDLFELALLHAALDAVTGVKPAIETRVRAEVAERDKRIKDAARRLRAVLIANADLLDVAFTNEPSLSPWTRSVKPALEALLAAVAAGSSPDTTPREKDHEIERPAIAGYDPKVQSADTTPEPRRRYPRTSELTDQERYEIEEAAAATWADAADRDDVDRRDDS